jgi:predicted transcriptional regulator
MAAYTRRVQAVLSDDQYETLSRLAGERHTPVSVLVRDAIETVYFECA